MFPRWVHSFEFFALGSQLLGNISWVKDRLEIHPLTLTFGPLLQHIAHNFKFVVPDDNSFLEWLLKRAELHRLSIHNMFIKNVLNIVIIFNQEGRLVGHQIEINRLPHGLHLIKTDLNVVFLCCSFTNINTDLRVLHQSHLKNFVESKTFSRSYIETDFLRDLIPMTFLHSLLSESHHKRNFRLELIQLSFDRSGNFKDGLDISFFEESATRSDSSHTFIYKLFSGWSV